MENKTKATHEGKITIGEIELQCAILSEGSVVVTYQSLKAAFGGKKGLVRIEYINLSGEKVQGVNVSILSSLLPITKESQVNSDMPTTGFDKMLQGLLRVPPPHK